MFAAGLSVLLVFSGLLVLWQIGSQPSSTFCLPFCAGGQLPPYIYGDFGVTFVLLGILFLFGSMALAVMGLRMLRAKR